VLQKSLKFHSCILWGLINANTIPSTPQPEHITAFKAYFSESTTNVDLQCTCTGKQLIETDLIEIGFLISPVTQKQNALAVKNIEEFILCFV